MTSLIAVLRFMARQPFVIAAAVFFTLAIVYGVMGK